MGKIIIKVIKENIYINKNSSKKTSNLKKMEEIAT